MDFADKKVNILGSEYTIKFLTQDEYDFNDAWGYFDRTLPLIRVRIPKDKDLDMDDVVGDLEFHFKDVIRHEIIHAFIYNSGLWSNSHVVNSWATDEEMTDWFAIQSPKIFKAFQEVNAI